MYHLYLYESLDIFFLLIHEEDKSLLQVFHGCLPVLKHGIQIVKVALFLLLVVRLFFSVIVLSEVVPNARHIPELDASPDCGLDLLNGAELLIGQVVLARVPPSDIFRLGLVALELLPLEINRVVIHVLSARKVT